MIVKVEKYLKDLDTTGLEIHIMSPVDAMHFTLPRAKAAWIRFPYPEMP